MTSLASYLTDDEDFAWLDMQSTCYERKLLAVELFDQQLTTVLLYICSVLLQHELTVILLYCDQQVTGRATH